MVIESIHKSQIYASLTSSVEKTTTGAHPPNWLMISTDYSSDFMNSSKHGKQGARVWGEKQNPNNLICAVC